MTARGDHAQVLASSGRGRSTRGARLCRHRLTGSLLPAHDQPGDACLPHRYPWTHTPLPDGLDPALSPLAAPLLLACTALRCPSAAPPSH